CTVDGSLARDGSGRLTLTYFPGRHATRSGETRRFSSPHVTLESLEGSGQAEAIARVRFDDATRLSSAEAFHGVTVTRERAGDSEVLRIAIANDLDPEVDGEFGVDLERHLAAYRFARARAAGRTVLDAGCGEGYGAALLAEVAVRVVGADRMEAIALARARHRDPRLELRAIDLERLDGLDGRFDLVVSFQVIEHLPDPVGFLAALARRAAPGGEILVTTPNRLMSLSDTPYHLRQW